MAASAKASQLRIGPQPGPQDAFLRCSADIAIYGGAAGGGKSYALLLDPLRHIHVRGFGGVVFRRTSPELVGIGGLWDTAESLYPITGGEARQNPNLDWRWPSGARIEFRHLQHESDKLSHQGRQYSATYWDELTHFTETQFTYLLSRVRSTCGVRPYVRATTNPDADSWVKKWIAWWIGDDGFPVADRSGVVRWFVRQGSELHWFDSEPPARLRFPDSIPMSFTFIGARLEDNPALLDVDPQYQGRLEALSLVDRERLRAGNWKIRPAAGLVFKREWMRHWTTLPSKRASWIQSWDMSFKGEGTKASDAKTEPDYVVGQVWAAEGARYCLVDQVRGRLSFRQTLEAIVALSQRWPQATTKLIEDKANGPAIVSMLESDVDGLVLVNPEGGKLSRANAVSPLFEAGNVELPPLEGHAWVTDYVEELVGFPEARHDDQVDTTSQALLRLRAPGAHRYLQALRSTIL